ncbi:uncharacterized protein LOC118197091 [Stegodyphus dumicola]|uniref:uncharacterized protein LOC118197091 n=1 Tax=Stegodyphus dumicola TaxID=202533 RepID=UPI0015AADF49|nr:uncharacterized protein LOC118197091 [Stegodyphus dumicola]
MGIFRVSKYLESQILVVLVTGGEGSKTFRPFPSGCTLSNLGWSSTANVVGSTPYITSGWDLHHTLPVVEFWCLPHFPVPAIVVLLLRQETIALSQKEKSRPSSGKFAPRPIAPARPQSPAVSAATLKVPDTNLVPNPLVNKAPTSDSPVPSDNLKSSESSNETQCKRNLLADIIEASGILLDNSSSEKSPVKKSDEAKTEKELTYHQETDLKATKSSKSCSSSDSSVSAQESTNVKSRPVKEISDDALSSEMEKNVTDNKKEGDTQVESTEIPAKETSKVLVSPQIATENPSSSEQVTQIEMQAAKDKNL